MSRSEAERQLDGLLFSFIAFNGVARVGFFLNGTFFAQGEGTTFYYPILRYQVAPAGLARRPINTIPIRVGEINPTIMGANFASAGTFRLAIKPSDIAPGACVNIEYMTRPIYALVIANLGALTAEIFRAMFSQELSVLAKAISLSIPVVNLGMLGAMNIVVDQLKKRPKE